MCKKSEQEQIREYLENNPDKIYKEEETTAEGRALKKKAGFRKHLRNSQHEKKYADTRYFSFKKKK